MSDIIISLIALLATFYQLYLQRVHNEKSLKPLIQIDLIDRTSLLGIRVQNNGVGPFIIGKVTFIKDEKHYANIEDCLNLIPKSYQYILIDGSVKKVVPPGAYLEIFSTQFEEQDTSEEINQARQQLSVLRLTVEGRDIYDNKVMAERDLHWFVRHSV